MMDRNNETIEITRKDFEDICSVIVRYTLIHQGSIYEWLCNGSNKSASYFEKDILNVINTEFDKHRLRNKDRDGLSLIRFLKVSSEEASRAYYHLYDILEDGERYPMVDDLYFSLGMPTPYSYYGKGWTSLKGFWIIDNGDGSYSFDIPKPEYVPNRKKNTD